MLLITLIFFSILQYLNYSHITSVNFSSNNLFITMTLSYPMEMITVIVWEIVLTIRPTSTS